MVSPASSRRLSVRTAARMWRESVRWVPRALTLQRHFFSPLSLGASDVRDMPGDCAVGSQPRRRGSSQSYTHAGATRRRITGGAATPSALGLSSPKRPCKCQRKKWASIVSHLWCCQPAYFRTASCAIRSTGRRMTARVGIGRLGAAGPLAHAPAGALWQPVLA